VQGGIVYAGNLFKSGFVYQLEQLSPVKFNLFGPGLTYKQQEIAANVRWLGEYAPDEIPARLNGSFGLIWDGNDIGKCDERLGNYLRYNNPHKFSLYLAAGLPVIAPRFSAIGRMIEDMNLGILVDTLYDLQNLSVTPEAYQSMRKNVQKVRQQIISGYFFEKALAKIEQYNEG
jgi:hypothetical protein